MPENYIDINKTKPFYEYNELIVIFSARWNTNNHKRDYNRFDNVSTHIYRGKGKVKASRTLWMES